jgi:hypothetical protein
MLLWTSIHLNKAFRYDLDVVKSNILIDLTSYKQTTIAQYQHSKEVIELNYSKA